jgi:hypothetical protein
MSVYQITDKKTIYHLYDKWNETLVWSCLQDVMGVAYADSLTSPQSAQICVGDFCFFAGAVNDELILNKPSSLYGNYAILTPQNEEWERAIERCYGERAQRHIRYAIKKERDVFDKEKLQGYIDALDTRYVLKPIDRALYDEILTLDWSVSMCSNYDSYEHYESIGLGVVALKDGEIVSGASSYTSFINGIEIEIDTREDERRKGLATACGTWLILKCLERGWYPSGYNFDREYPVYEVEFD